MAADFTNDDNGDLDGRGIVFGSGDDALVHPIRYRPINLRTPLRHQFDKLLSDYGQLFGGRSEELAGIARRLNEPAGGYLVITAPAGFGKTALIAALMAASPQAFAYHFFNTVYVAHSVDESCFLRNVVEQIAQWFGYDEEAIPERLDQLTALYFQLMRQELAYSRFLVLDGLDEVSAWPLRNYLVHPLPAGLHIIVTIRATGTEWMDDYNFPRRQTRHIALKGLSPDEVVLVLQAAGEPAAGLAADETRLEEIVRVAAYPDDESLGADPFYIRWLAEDLVTGRLAPADIGQQPRGLLRYLDGWWSQIRQAAGDEAARDLVGTLAVAEGPISRADLIAVNPSLGDPWQQDAIDDSQSPVRRFVAGSDSTGYLLTHPRLLRYVDWRLRLPKYAQRLLDYCRGWADHASPYALAFYARHLAHAGETGALFSLIDQAWMAAKVDHFGSNRSFAEDLALIVDVASADARIDYLPSLVKACLVHSELLTRAPPAIIGILAQIGHPDRAMDYAALVAETGERVEAYGLIALALAEQGQTAAARRALVEAGKAIRTMPQGNDRWHLTAWLAADFRTAGLPVPRGRRAPDLPEAGIDAWTRGRLVALAECLSDGLAGGGDGHGSPPEGSFDLLDGEQIESWLAFTITSADQPGRTTELLLDCLSGVIDWGYPRGDGPLLQEVARALAQNETDDLLEQIAALAPNDSIQSWALAQLATGLSSAGDQAGALRLANKAWAIQEALVEADASGGQWHDEAALTAIAQVLARAGQQETAAKVVARVLTTTRAAGFEKEKTSALLAMARALVDNGQPDGALAAARLSLVTAEKILDEWDRSFACDELVALLLRLGDPAGATRAARLLLPHIDFFDSDQLEASLTRCALALVETLPAEEAVEEIRFSTNWDYEMENDEIAAILDRVALELARKGKAEAAVLLVADTLELWPDGQSQADVAAALARQGFLDEAATVVERVIGQAADGDRYDDEESYWLQESLLMALYEADLEELAWQAVTTISSIDRQVELLSGLVNTLAIDGRPAEARAITKKAVERIIALDGYDDLAGSRFLKGFSLALTAAGETSLAWLAAMAIPNLDDRAECLVAASQAIKRQATDNAGQSIEADLDRPAFEVPGEQPAALQPPAVQQRPRRRPSTKRIMNSFLSQLLDNGLPDRVTIFDSLEGAAGELALMDRGQTLALIVEAIETVDRWWGR